MTAQTVATLRETLTPSVIGRMCALRRYTMDEMALILAYVEAALVSAEAHETWRDAYRTSQEPSNSSTSEYMGNLGAYNEKRNLALKAWEALPNEVRILTGKHPDQTADTLRRFVSAAMLPRTLITITDRPGSIFDKFTNAEISYAGTLFNLDHKELIEMCVELKAQRNMGFTRVSNKLLFQAAEVLNKQAQNVVGRSPEMIMRAILVHLGLLEDD